MKYVHYYILISFFLLFTEVNAQFRTAIRTSLYAGTDGVLLNPSFSTDQPVFASLNLLSAELFLMNNQFRFLNSKYFTAFNNQDAFQVYDGGFTNKYVFADVSFEGPSFSMNLGRYAGGFFTRARSLTDVRKIPKEFADIYLNGFQYEELKGKKIEFNNVEVNNLTWLEFGGNFSKMLSPRNYTTYIVGVSAKYLKGISATRYRLDSFKASILDSSMALESLKAEYQQSAPTGSGWSSGSGFSVDLGITYKRYFETADHYHPNKKFSDCAVWDYKYKLSASLLDIGYIRFNKGVSQGSVDANYTTPTAQDQNTDIEQILEEQSTDVNTKPFTVIMPTMASVQLDYALKYHFYLNGTVLISLFPRSFNGLQVPGNVVFTPRYDRKNIGFFVPISMYRFVQPQIGFALRIRSFYIGTDKVIPFFMNTNIYGASIYTSLKVNLYKNPACKVKKRKEKRVKPKSTPLNNSKPKPQEPSSPPKTPTKDPVKDAEQTVPLDDQKQSKPDEMQEFPKEEKPAFDPKSNQEDQKPIDGGSNFIKEEIKVDGPDNIPQLDQDEVKETIDADPNLNIQKPKNNSK